MTDARVSQEGVVLWTLDVPDARVSQLGAEVWTTGAPKALVSQLGITVWVVTGASTAHVRASQSIVEVAEFGTPKAIASQIVAEVEASGSPLARASQLVAEVEASGSPSARASQLIAEVLGSGSAVSRISQIVIEVLVANLQVLMPPIYPDLPGRTFPTVVRPKAFNLGTKTATGKSVDVQIASAPIWEFELNYSVLRNGFYWREGSDEWLTLLGFFLRLNGTFGRFLLNIEWDNQVQNQPIATTDGVNAVWTIVRTLGRGANAGTEPVGYVNLDLQFNVYLDGIAQDHSTWQVIQTTPGNQQLKFFNTPSAGQKLTVDMSYFYYCKFADDTYDFSEFMRDLFDAQKITVQSDKA